MIICISIRSFVRKAFTGLAGIIISYTSLSQTLPKADRSACPSPVITLQPDGYQFCLTGNAVFIVNATDALTYQWQLNTGSGWNDLTDGGIYSGSQVPALAVSLVTTPMNGYRYRCLVSNACGTTISDEGVLTVRTPATPAISITTSVTTICAGTSITCFATVTDGGANPVYQWKKNGTNIGTNNQACTDNAPANGDVYTCTLLSNAFCLATNNVVSNPITITVNQPSDPQVSITASANNICPGTPVTFTATTTGQQPGYFSWFRNGNNVQTSGTTYTLNDLVNGDIIFCISPGGACPVHPIIISNGITMQLLPPPAGFLGPDTAMCSYGSITLKPVTPFGSYHWSDGSSGNSLSISSPGNYWLQVTDGNGCTGKDSITVNLKECLKGFYMPTGFTPNHDGKNDLLKPQMLGNVAQYHFWVYDRWGQLVFDSHDPARGWDGTNQGKALDTGVFVWMCSYQFTGEGPVMKKGTVTLIR